MEYIPFQHPKRNNAIKHDNDTIEYQESRNENTKISTKTFFCHLFISLLSRATDEKK
ncbi:MAG: hypothetical protein DDT22_00896 [candidate division WS2 bacterium]|nr:hypothetical protein [Candidatus Lithacetigena glycinireducens]